MSGGKRSKAIKATWRGARAADARKLSSAPEQKRRRHSREEQHAAAVPRLGDRSGPLLGGTTVPLGAVSASAAGSREETSA